MKKYLELLPKKDSKPDTSRPVVCIPNDIPLAEPETHVLSKGLKFVPNRRRVDDFTLEKDLEAFFRRIKLHEHFNDLNSNIRGKLDDTYPKYKLNLLGHLRANLVLRLLGISIMQG
jgi:hypothetical protein